MDKSSNQKKSYHHGNLRDALIKTGISLLEEENAREITLRKVAKRAGVSHAAPYRHFEDKLALLSAIAEHGFRELAAEMQKAIDEHSGNHRRQIISIGQRYVAFAQQHPAQLTLMFSDLLSQGGDEGLHEAAGGTYQILEQSIINAQSHGTLKPDDPQKVGNAFWATVHGLAMLTKEGLMIHEGQELDEAVENVLELMFVGMGT
ncbi:MAG: TetR/AcrR family transcriptional regulator [Chloroflexota bacterium]